MSIPKELFNSISEDESILYVSNKLVNNRTKWIKRGISLAIIIGLTVLFYSLEFEMLVEDWVKGDFDELDIFLIILPIIGIVIFPLLFRMISNVSKKDQFFVITDKNIHIYTYGYEEKSQYVQQLELESIIGIIYSKSIFNEKGHGNLNLIQQSFSGLLDSEINEEEYYTPIYELKNIPKFGQFQIILESILNEFGEISQKWNSLRSKFDLEVPLRFDISKPYVKAVKDRQKRLMLYAILIAVGCGILTVLLVFFFDIDLVFSSEFKMIGIFLWLGIVLAPLFGTMVPILLIREIYLMRKRLSPIRSTLNIGKRSISVQKEDGSSEIPLSDTVSLSYVKIKKPDNTEIKWEQNIDGILISPDYDSKEVLIFGPIEDFSTSYQQIFYYLISWKAQQGILLDKAQLLEQQTQPEELIPMETEHKILYTDVQPVEKKEFSIEPRTPSESVFNSFKNYLDPQEKVLLSYTASVNLYKNITVILICIPIFIGAIVFMMFHSFDNSFFSTSESVLFTFLFPLILTIIAIGVCIIQLCTLSSKRTQNNAQFVFTTKKILAKYSRKYIITPYENIYNIGRQNNRFISKSHTVIIHLEKPIEYSPFMNKYSIFISDVPNENPLMEKINFLKENIDSFRNNSN